MTGTTVYKDIAGSQSITRLKKYDVLGNVVKAQLGCCNEREYVLEESNSYSTPTQVMSGTSSLNLETSMEEDFNTGMVTQTTNPRGEDTNYTFDASLRLDTVTSHTGASKYIDYDDSNLTSSQTLNWEEGTTNKSATTSQAYDGWGRVIKVTSPNGGKTDTTYDEMGRVSKQSNPYTGTPPGVETEMTYDALGRATIMELPDGDTVTTSYSGTTVTVTDQVNRQMKREMDGLGRLVKVYEQTSAGALTQETSHTYDLMDRLKEINQGGQLRKYKYDDLGRLLFERIPEQSATINDGTGTMWSCKYTYTDFDSVATKTDARGVITTYSYDDLHRLTGVSYNTSGASGVASTPALTYNYSTSGATIGLMTSIWVGGQASSGGYEENYSYDGNSRVSSAGHKFNIGGSSTRTYTMEYEYTNAGQVTEMTYPSSRELNISYDSLGRLSSIVNAGTSSTYLSSISYNTAGQTSGWTLGSNIVETFGYDTNRMQLTSQTVTQNSNTRLSLTYSYEATIAGQMGSGSTAGNAGQLISVTGSIDGQTEFAGYSYDNLGRLRGSTQTTNGVEASRYFVYDRWGNRTQVAESKESDPLQTVTLEETSGIPTNRIDSVSDGSYTFNYTYDSAGNVTNDGVHTYTYDGENRLVSVDGGTTASYMYDHQNRRVKKVVSSTTTHYIWEGGQVIAEHNGSSGAVITEYICSGSRMIAREQGGNRIYFLYDLLSARATITDGAGGSIQGRQAHLPFGEELNSTGTNDKHRFTSYERDSETGSDYAINRGYSQVLGRFLQADPYRASGSAEDPQSWNRYRYSRNDPVNLVDPNGLLEWNPYACGAGYHWDFWAARCVPNGTAHNPGLPWSDLNLGTLWGSLPLMLPPLSPGLGLKDYWATELINALKGLSQECKNFLGTDAAINQRIAEINSGALPIRVVTETSKDQIPNSPRGETFSQYWNRLPEATRINSVAYTVNYGGQAQPYNRIIVGPMFYSGSPDLLPFVNNKIGDFRALTLVHEFMHVLNNMGDVALFNKWKEEGATLDDSLHPSIALFKWLADNCPNTK